MRIVDRGNANLLVDYGDPEWLYRCCVRFPDSLRLCNQYTLENAKFINEKIKPIFGDMLCCMNLEIVQLSRINLLKEYITNLDDEQVYLLKIRKLKYKPFQLLHKDHFTSFYGLENALVMEFKPKWLYSSLNYCRNCTHNSLKNRSINYCYAILLSNPQHFRDIARSSHLPEEFVEDMVRYFSQSNNVLKVLHDAQKQTDLQPLSQISSLSDVTDQLLLCMTLRDVTCFITWHAQTPISVEIVDVDLKPRERWTHWFGTHQMLASSKKHHH